MFEKYTRDALILWATVDPIGTLALFAAITARLAPAARRRAALKAVLYAGTVLVAAIVSGQILLGAMGIRLVSLQVAGGIILFLFGLQMIFGAVGASGPPAGEEGHDIAVFPLAVPSIASPGAIMAVILLTDNYTYSIPAQAGTAAVLVIILAITYALMRLADPILRVIGHNGAEILIRVMGMLLAALSIELVMEAVGLPQWIRTAPLR